MKLNIEYAENIIVGTLHNGQWKWFVSEKEDWILDKKRFEQAFESNKSNTVEKDDSFIDDQAFAQNFLIDMNDFGVTKNELSSALSQKLPATSWDEIIEYCPSLYVNFDQKFLKSLYPELMRFEEFVPKGWLGSYEDFLGEVPEEERFWIIKESDIFYPFLDQNAA